MNTLYKFISLVGVVEQNAGAGSFSNLEVIIATATFLRDWKKRDPREEPQPYPRPKIQKRQM